MRLPQLYQMRSMPLVIVLEILIRPRNLDYTYIQLSTKLTSYEVSTTTTVSVQATDSAQATSLFSSLSATLALPTPTQTATSVSGTAVVPTTPLSTVTTTTSLTSNETTVVPTTSAPVQFTGGARIARSEHGYMLVISALMVVPGILMVLL
jgi:hypothetical protein